MLSHSQFRIFSPMMPAGATSAARASRILFARVLFFVFILAFAALCAYGQDAGPPRHAGGEANLILPDFDQATFLGGITGRNLLMSGLAVGFLGLLFGLMMYKHLRALPVHKSMLEVSELIYETCKTYLLTQGKFLLILEVFIESAGMIFVALSIIPLTRFKY